MNQTPDKPKNDKNRDSAHDWKHTLTLPQTDFPMRGNLPKREPDFLARWDELDLYGQWQARDDADSYVLHDGPPYANGEIHIGHALNKVLKDIIVKYQAMLGKRVPYVPGWDCHGLPIETQVSKKLKKKVRDLTDSEFRTECRAYADKHVELQRSAFKRLGVQADWDNPYLTMSYGYEAETLRKLADLVEQGYVFRRRKPVAWSIENRTALAEAELEYHDKKDLSVYVMFNINFDGQVPDAIRKSGAENASLMIWTTTPWTLPANLAVACHPDVDYGLFSVKKAEKTNHIVMAKALAEKVFEAAEVDHWETVVELKGGDLLGIEYQHPFVGRIGKVVGADYVTTEDGTGLVHTAPGHGADDYDTGLREDLDIYCPVLDNGRYDESVPDWLAGLSVWEANSKIAEHLLESGHLFHQNSFVHSYPHDWRSKKPIIFRATWQWFIGMENHNLRDKALEAITQTEWTPDWGETRIRAMVENRPDWCISRQRRWGVPIAVPYCEKCGEAYLDAELMRRVAIRFEAKGADAWFEDDVHDFMAPESKCQACEHDAFVRGNDILDVWFDSGASWAAVCAKRPELSVPADLYLEGSDQHRGWFQSSLMLGTALLGQAPFKGVLTHGFVVDGKGHKMSKSAGNVIDPAKIVKQYGAEILRLWIASEQYDDDIRISNEIIQGVVDAYRRIRNTFKFLAGNLFDFDPEQHAVNIESMEPIDRWMLQVLTQFEAEIHAAYEKNAFHLVYQRAIRFCSVELSALYLDVAKDRLYVDTVDGLRRRSAQTVVYRLTESLSLLLAPILSFTAEELWQHLPGDRPESVFLSKLQPPRQFSLGESEQKSWATLREIRDAVLKPLEVARAAKQIGHSLQARVILSGRGTIAAILEEEQAFLPDWFISSQVELTHWQDERLEETNLEDLKVHITNAEGEKCARCWQIQPEVGTLAHADLCQRCNDVVKEMA